MYPEIADNTWLTKKGERGAALITVLFVSTLLLAAGGALILVTSTASRTAIDSTAEMQAYYSAEAGLEDSLNVLRGNIAPNASMPAGTQISFRNAVTLSTSNLSTDTSARARLSGWLNYSYTPSGVTNPDRVPLTAGYTAMTGLAYSVDVSDPDGTVPPNEPTRLLLRVTGYGPKGAVKRLELSVKFSNIDYAPPAMLMMRGSNDGTPVTFDIGNSIAKDYSGHDRPPSTSILPTFGATIDSDRDIEIASDGKDTAAAPKASSFTDPSLPVWLRSATDARNFLADQKANAISQNRPDGSCSLAGPDASPGCSYYTSFSGNATGFTFVDGDCTLDGGSGLLIVTGNLEMNGNPNFTGLILVLGGGTVNRDGGGNGNIYGAMAVARFAASGNGGFLGATFHTNGGGTSSMQYDSKAVRSALSASGPRVLGVHEY